MSTKTKFFAVALAALTLAGSFAVTTEAEAKGGKKALAIGLGAALVGAAIVDSYHYRYRRDCYWTTTYNAYDEPVRVRVCD